MLFVICIPGITLLLADKIILESVCDPFTLSDSHVYVEIIGVRSTSHINQEYIAQR